MGLLCDRSGKSRCTDLENYNRRRPTQGPELSLRLRLAPARAKPLHRPQRERDRPRLPSAD
jgi:hypothetical protein